LGATDPRDMIYRLLGLANDFQELGVEADYEKSCVKIYTDFAKKLIEHSHVDLLSLAQFPKSLESNETTPLPSWVPHWTGLIRKPCGELSR
jgi:hypothetical protein